MNYPIQGYGNPMMNRMIRWNVDDNGQTHGTTRDAQSRVDARTGLIDHGASAAANAKEGFWDLVGMIPVVGGAVNIARGAIKGIAGLVTGRGYLAKEGLRNMVKGGLYLIPGWGTAIAGANLAKNAFDTVAHGAMAIGDKARFGGFDAKNQFAMQMAYGNMGYGMQLSNPMSAYAGYGGGGYGFQGGGPGYW